MLCSTLVEIEVEVGVELGNREKEKKKRKREKIGENENRHPLTSFPVDCPNGDRLQHYRSCQ